MGTDPAIAVEHKAAAVKIFLIQTEYDVDILRHPALGIGILIYHPQLLHHTAAARVFNIVRSGDKRDSCRLRFTQNRRGGLRRNAPAPVIAAQCITEVMRVAHKRYVPDRTFIRPQANGIAAICRRTRFRQKALMQQRGRSSLGFRRKKG